jgi:hypothetical protein
MRSALIAGVALLILIGGSFMGVAALLLLPIAGVVLLVALLIWVIQRRASGKPPIP